MKTETASAPQQAQSANEPTPLTLPPSGSASGSPSGPASGGFIGTGSGGAHSQYWASPRVPLLDPFQTLAPPAIPPQAERE